MLRHSAKFAKVSRSWTTSGIASATAHFPREVQVDPAAVRAASTSAKETRNWSLGMDDAAMAKMPKHLQRLTTGTKLYCEMVRFNRPAGWQFLAIPCLWGSSLAVSRALVWEGADPVVLFAPFIPFHLLVSFMAGAYLMRSAGCVVNDWLDRDFDRQVERTADRPFATGRAGAKEALLVLTSHVGLSALIALNLSPAALVACLAVTPIWVTYPLMKRYTYFPQISLGLCYSWGIFVGYAAVLGRIDWAVCLPAYAAAVVWVILYDTLYAFQDIKDDKKCGVKSSAIWIGDRKHLLHLLIIPVFCGLMISGATAPQATPYYLGIILCTYHLYHIVDDVNIYDPWSCGVAFKRNVRFGFLIFLAMCLGNLVWAVSSEHEAEKDTEHDSVTEDSPMFRFLFMYQHKSSPQYDAEGFSWLDRMLHPAFVQSEVARAQGALEPPPIPAWMRREYIGENVGSIARFLGVPEETLRAVSQWWYESVDHYNMFSKIQL
eukprot:gene8282-5801_t